MFKELLDQLKIDVLNIELYTVHTEWQHNNVISPYSRLYHITSGVGWITMNAKKICLEPGYSYLIPAFTAVNMYCPDYFTHYYIHFTTEMPYGHNLFSTFQFCYKIKAEQMNLPKDIFQRLLKLNPGMELIERDANKPIYNRMLQRHKMLNKDKPVADLIETNAYMRLLIAQFLKPDFKNDYRSFNLGFHRFEKTIKYINDNLTGKINLTELASTANLSSAYFSTLFARFFGVPPLQYVNNKKIQKAQILLLATDNTVEEIADMLGYEDVFYFSRIFKKITGIAPSIYRKQSQYL